MLVVVKYGNLHPLTKLALDIEAFRSLDILQIDATERGLEARNDVYDFVWIGFVDFDIEDIDTGELLE